MMTAQDEVDDGEFVPKYLTPSRTSKTAWAGLTSNCAVLSARTIDRQRGPGR